MKTRTPIIGLEIHVELKTKSKMFCGCTNDPFGAPEPNVYTCPVCLGMPGALPVANKAAVEWTILLGEALGCTIAAFSKFDRKHYFYPDLPKGYQISQYDQPLCINGVIETSHGAVRIHRVHLEEDTGKLLHTTLHRKRVSLVDFNRSGVPLVEIVTEADITSAGQAKEYAKAIRDIVRTLGISTADMEKGSMRLEANISLTDTPGKLPAYKVEVKNINSFKFLEQAITYEIKRQTSILDSGKTPKQETRGWNEAKNETFSQRSKENAEDYRYFPDPDLPPMTFDNDELERIRKQLPELPSERKMQLVSLGTKTAYLEAALSPQYKHIRFTKLNAEAEKQGVAFNDVLSAVINKKVGGENASEKEIVSRIKALASFENVSNDAVVSAVHAVIASQPKAVGDYKAGKQQVLGFLMGMVMQEIGKKVDPKRVMAELQRAMK